MKKLLILTLLLGASAFAQNYYQFPPSNRYPGGQYYVCAFPAVGNPCSNQVAVYPTSALVTPLPQPISTVSDGSSAFWLSNAFSQIVIEVQPPNGASFTVSFGGGAASGNVVATTVSATGGIQALPPAQPYIAIAADPTDICPIPLFSFSASQVIICNVNPGQLFANWGTGLGDQQIFLIRPPVNAPTNGQVAAFNAPNGDYELANAVSSVGFVGDGTVLNNTVNGPVTLTGNLTASLANAAAGTVLNNTGAAAAPPTYTTNLVLGATGVGGGATMFGSTSASVVIAPTPSSSALTFTSPGLLLKSSGCYDFAQAAVLNTFGAEMCALGGSTTEAVSFTSGGNNTGLIQTSGMCHPTSAVTLSTSATAFCTFSLPNSSQNWGYHCFVSYTVSAGTTPTISFGINPSQTPNTASVAFAIIYATTTAPTVSAPVTSLIAGNQNIATSATLTPSVTAAAEISGMLQGSATAGTLAITSTGTGTGFAGTINVGTTCWLE